jgi:hypothetical protein
MVELTGKWGMRDGEEWQEVRIFKDTPSLMDIFRNRPGKRTQRLEWVPAKNILYIKSRERLLQNEISQDTYRS